jgi:ribonuclease HI
MSPRRAIQRAIQDEGGFDLERLEAITPHIAPPWWTSPSTYIERNAEKAEARHQYRIRSEPDAIHIDTDGSGINGHVGVAAVCTTTHQTKSACMGDETVSTVYPGELQGIILALQIAQEDRGRGNRRKKVLIYTDNQAAIQAAAKPRGTSGAYCFKTLRSNISSSERKASSSRSDGFRPPRESTVTRRPIARSRRPRDGDKEGRLDQGHNNPQSCTP